MKINFVQFRSPAAMKHAYCILLLVRRVSRWPVSLIVTWFKFFIISWCLKIKYNFLKSVSMQSYNKMIIYGLRNTPLEFNEHLSLPITSICINKITFKSASQWNAGDHTSIQLSSKSQTAPTNNNYTASKSSNILFRSELIQLCYLFHLKTNL